jgi:hypothetical protein
MKNFFKINFAGRTIAIVMLVLTSMVLWTSCTDEMSNISNAVPDSYASAKGSAQTGGNGECPVGTQNSTGRINYDNVSGNWYTSGQSFANGNAAYDFGDVGFKIVVSADGKSFAWSSDLGICVKQIIIKGATSNTVYSYDGTVKSGSGLTAPLIKGVKGLPQISNATICYDVCPVDHCYDYDTAFGGETIGAGAGWWFAFDDVNGTPTQNLYAGQNKLAGTVTIENGGYSINFAEGFSLTTEKADGTPVLQAVKIGGYNVLPTVRPSAGNYEKSGGVTLVKGGDLSGTLTTYPYYVVHLDVKQVVACPL